MKRKNRLCFINLRMKTLQIILLCFEQIGALIERLRVESGCSVKPLMKGVHIGHSALKGVYMAKLSTCCTI